LTKGSQAGSLHLLHAAAGNAAGTRLERNWTSSERVQQRNWAHFSKKQGSAKEPLYPIRRNISDAAGEKDSSAALQRQGQAPNVSQSVRAQKDRRGDARMGYAGRTPANHARTGHPGRGVARRLL